MLKVDFGQSLLDHCGILILVQPVGYIGDKKFKGIYDEISSYSRAQVPNTTRTLHLKYKCSKRVTPPFFEWGSFHFHKRVLGLVCVAKCSEIAEVEKLEKPINELKNHLSPILLNARCFVFGCKSSDGGKIRKDFVVIGGQDHSKELENSLAEFVASLFNVLESKRLSILSENVERFSLIQAPIEQEFSGSENDSRAVKRRHIGRSKKYTGDLCMLAGLPQDALSQYCIAAELLRTVNDVLWLAGSLEGQCAASVALNSTAVPESSKFLVLPTECAANSVNVSTNGLGSDIDEAKFRNPVPFTEEEILEKLYESLRLYNKMKGPVVIETEAHLKLTRLLTSYQRRIEASIALSNALFVNLPVSEQEKIQLYSTAVVLFDEMGFSRKAGFFRRIAAMHCVSQKLPEALWPQSYSLLLSALEGYKISTDQRKFSKDHPYGWPALQAKLLNELIYTAHHLGDPSLSVRHTAFLLQTMHDHLSDSEKRELSGLLEGSSKHCTGSPTEKDNSKMGKLDFPMVSLTRMPIVKSFKVNSLAAHLKPMAKKLSNAVSSGPFIFSSLRRYPKEARKSKSMTWVCEDVGEVTLEVYNPMPFELKVSKMLLCANGVEFEPFPACLSLPPAGGPHTVILLGIPHSVGQLKITGYTVHVLGIESTCSLTQDNLDNKEDFPVVVEVVPSMPQLLVSSALPKVRSQPTDPDSPSSARLVTAVTLYAGQRIKGTVTLENIGKMSVDHLTVSVRSQDGEGANELFSFDNDEIISKLPLLPGKSTNITVTITGAHHFPQGLGSGENLSYDPEAPWGLTGAIQFRYFSEESGSNMCRKATMSIDVTVVPSMLCENYQVLTLPSDRSRCLLAFDAVNKTSNDMELFHSVHSSKDQPFDDEVFVDEVISIQGNDSNKVVIHLPRFSIRVPGEGNQQDRSNAKRRTEYTQAVRDMVKLRWSLPACVAGGSGNVDNLILNEDMISAIKPDPITFGVKVNGAEYNDSRQSEHSISLSTIVDFCVEVTNRDDQCHGPLLLCIDPYQDQANGCPVSELDGKVTWIGTLKQPTPELLPGESFSHSCSLVFLYPGLFMVAVSCSEIREQPRETCKEISSEVREKTRISTRQSQLETKEIREKSWMFRPPIKINVV